ncbi:18833_t:CDS:2, partial [Entrophospora sp. SA101]
WFQFGLTAPHKPFQNILLLDISDKNNYTWSLTFAPVTAPVTTRSTSSIFQTPTSTTVDNKPTSATNDTAASSSSPFATPNDNKGINENEIIGSSIIELTRNNNTYD